MILESSYEAAQPPHASLTNPQKNLDTESRCADVAKAL